MENKSKHEPPVYKDRSRPEGGGRTEGSSSSSRRVESSKCSAMT